MYKAFTLIEISIATAILIIILYFISPVYFYLNHYFYLNNEVEKIKSFIYAVQQESHYTQKNFSIVISQNNTQNKWCLIAIRKQHNNQITCDCLNVKICNLKSEYHIYHNESDNSIIYSNSLYPKVFFDIDSKTGLHSPKCLKISINNLSKIMQFTEYGAINVISENKRSTCNKY